MFLDLEESFQKYNVITSKPSRLQKDFLYLRKRPKSIDFRNLVKHLRNKSLIWYPSFSETFQVFFTVYKIAFSPWHQHEILIFRMDSDHDYSEVNIFSCVPEFIYARVVKECSFYAVNLACFYVEHDFKYENVYLIINSIRKTDVSNLYHVLKTTLKNPLSYFTKAMSRKRNFCFRNAL